METLMSAVFRVPLSGISPYILKNFPLSADFVT